MSDFGTRQRIPKRRTRVEILDRAVDEVDKYGGTDLPKVKDIVGLVRDGMTTGAAYQIWPNQEAFWADLRDELADRTWCPQYDSNAQRNIRAAVVHCPAAMWEPRYKALVEEVGSQSQADKYVVDALRWAGR